MAGIRGRVSKYTRILAEEICERISAGETLPQICCDEHIPSRPTIIDWVNRNRDGFADRYAKARALLHDYWADEIVSIGDDGTNDWIDRETKNGRKIIVVDRECVQRSALRIDTRKWLLSKLRPDKYGDRTMLGDSKGGNELVVTVRSVLDPASGDTSNKEKK